MVHKNVAEKYPYYLIRTIPAKGEIGKTKLKGKPGFDYPAFGGMVIDFVQKLFN
ncbi:MAG TPA: hypothetical protein VK618_11015 [Flavitalea sp.]|nr:hypothetical protein [Flavitalea sp.]